MRTGLITLATGLLVSAFASAAEPNTEGSANAASVKQWSFWNGREFPGATGSIAWDGTQGHDGPGCLAVKYSFVGGGNYVQATSAVPAGVNAQVARLWLKKPAGHKITFRVVDSNGRTFQKGVAYQNPDWQQIEVDLTNWESSWGGAEDGKLRLPLKNFAVLVENSDPAKEGVLLIDDLEFAAATRDQSQEVTYRPVDWEDQSRESRIRPHYWSVGGGAGNSLNGSEWRYQFNGGSRPEIRTDFSLFGEPASLRLVVDSDGSGHGVEVQLGSHFQGFSKEIGKLTNRGEQVIETPLGKLDGWKHGGGANDGQVRQPLRLQGIKLVAGNGPKSGTVRLKRIEIVTRPQRGQSVVLVPDIVQSGHTLTFKVRAINLQSKAISGTLTCNVQQLDKILSGQRKTIELAANGGQVDWSISQPMGTSKFVEAVFQWQDDTFVSRPVSIGTCTPSSKAGSSKLQPESFMGAGLYLYRYRGSHNYREQITRTCELAQRAGIKWTREEIQWHATEPVEGKFDWQFYDDLVAIARAHGISVYGLLGYWSNWADANTPKGVEQYCRWARQVVRHYRGRINHWEIWNEPNIFFWTGPKKLYGELLRQAYDAIKAEDPNAVVMGCSTAGIDTRFIKNVMAWGGKFDALTIHPYRGALDDLHFIKELQDVRELVGGRDVWLTEIGFPSQLIDGWSERRQASLAARVYLCTAASGAGRSVSWYDFRNDGGDPFYNESNFGLVRSDLRLKPAYGALATLGGLIGDMHVVGKVDVGPDAYAFRFTNGRRDVVAACAPDRAQVMAVRGAFDRVINAFGEESSVGKGSAPTPITLDVGFPVYLAGRAGFELRSAETALSYGMEPSAVSAGGVCTFRIESASQVEIVRWELPLGWHEPRLVGTNVWRLDVPSDGPACTLELQAIVRMNNGTTVRLPAKVHVAPVLIHV